jgi:hypothetical protein
MKEPELYTMEKCPKIILPLDCKSIEGRADMNDLALKCGFENRLITFLESVITNIVESTTTVITSLKFLPVQCPMTSFTINYWPAHSVGYRGASVSILSWHRSQASRNKQIDSTGPIQADAVHKDPVERDGRGLIQGTEVLWDLQG